MVIREYEPADCEELYALFCDTVHAVNAKDYTREQLDAWAPGAFDREEWNRSLTAHYALVAVGEGKLLGFGDVDGAGRLDRLFVHRDYQGRGIAAALCDRLERAAGGSVTTNASITARPFFERRGYALIREQRVERRGVALVNFLMKKDQ